MGSFTKKERTEQIFEELEKAYPYAKCELNYENDFQLLVAVILSAQCTDKRVNAVTPSLFSVASTPYEFAVMKQEELEKLIFSCGFYKNKSKSIISASKAICENWAPANSKVGSWRLPTDSELTQIANVISSETSEKNYIDRYIGSQGLKFCATGNTAGDKCDDDG